jgi:MFS family permease
MSRDNQLITLALFLWGSGEGLFIYIQPLYMERDLGATPAEVGAVLALAALLTACAFILGGLLADRFDPKKVMIGGWVLGGLSSLLMGLAPNWQAFIPAILIYNISAYCIPAINTYIAEASGDAPLEHTITVTFAGYAAGSIVAPFVGGRLAEAIGTSPLFIIGGVIFFISLIVALQVNSHAAHRHRATLPLRQQLDRLRPMAAFFTRIGFISLAMMIGMTLTANYLGKLGWSLGDVDTWGGTAQAIGMTILAIGLGRLAAGRQRRGLIAGQGLVWLSMILFLITTPTLRFTAVAGYFFLGGIASVRELSNAQIAGQVNREVRGLALGMNETLYALARSLAAALAGILFTLDLRLPLIASLALIPIGIVLVTVSRPIVSREEFIVIASPGTVVIESVED